MAGLRGGLRLAAITVEAVLRLQAATLSVCGLVCGASCAWGHGGLPGSVREGLCRVASPHVHVTPPLRVWADGMTAA